MDKFITYAVIGVLCTMLLTYLNKQANTKVAPVEGDVFQLRVHKLYLYLGIISIFLGILLFVLPGLTVEDGNGWLIGLCFLIFFGGIGTILTLWYTNHKFDFDSNKIEATSVYGKKTTLKWEEIKSIKFNVLSSLLVFTDNKGKKVKAHQHLIGISELLIAMENNTDWKIKDLKLPFKQ